MHPSHHGLSHVIPIPSHLDPTAPHYTALYPTSSTATQATTPSPHTSIPWQAHREDSISVSAVRRPSIELNAVLLTSSEDKKSPSIQVRIWIVDLDSEIWIVRSG